MLFWTSLDISCVCIHFYKLCRTHWESYPIYKYVCVHQEIIIYRHIIIQIQYHCYENISALTDRYPIPDTGCWCMSLTKPFQLWLQICIIRCIIPARQNRLILLREHGMTLSVKFEISAYILRDRRKRSNISSGARGIRLCGFPQYLSLRPLQTCISFCFHNASMLGQGLLQALFGRCCRKMGGCEEQGERGNTLRYHQVCLGWNRDYHQWMPRSSPFRPSKGETWYHSAISYWPWYVISLSGDGSGIRQKELSREMNLC